MLLLFLFVLLLFVSLLLLFFVLFFFVFVLLFFCYCFFFVVIVVFFRDSNIISIGIAEFRYYVVIVILVNLRKP